MLRKRLGPIKKSSNLTLSDTHEIPKTKSGLCVTKERVVESKNCSRFIPEKENALQHVDFIVNQTKVPTSQQYSGKHNQNQQTDINSKAPALSLRTSEQLPLTHCLKIAQVVRFDNSKGNNNCWLNCVMRVLGCMLRLVPNERIYQKSSNPMIDSLLLFINNMIEMKNGGTLFVDNVDVHVEGEINLMSIKFLFSKVINDPDFDSAQQQDASEGLGRILDAFQEEEPTRRTVLPFSFSKFEYLYRWSCSHCLLSYNSNPVKENILKVPVPEREDLTTLFDMKTAIMSTLHDEKLLGPDRKCRGCNLSGMYERMLTTLVNDFLIVQLLFFDSDLNKKSDSCIPTQEFTCTALDTEHILQLQCIIEHRGSSIRSGHYVCYFKQDEHWYLASDLYVSRVSVDKLPKQPYISIYKKI